MLGLRGVPWISDSEDSKGWYRGDLDRKEHAGSLSQHQVSRSWDTCLQAAMSRFTCLRLASNEGVISMSLLV